LAQATRAQAPTSKHPQQSPEPLAVMAPGQFNEPLHYTPAADAGGCADGS